MVKVAIIGTGGIAKKHIQAINSIPNANIVALNDLNFAIAEEMAGATGATAYATPQQAIEAADLVYILTPPSTRRTLSLLAIEAGKPVVCEKPLAISLEDGQAIADAARLANIKFMMAFNMRFKKGFRFLKNVINSGQLGAIYHFWSHRMGQGISPGYNWRTDPNLLCGMTIESLSHDIDMLRWLVGDPVNVTSTVYETRPDLPGFDTDVSATFSLEQGGTALIHASWSSHLGMNARGVLGSQGTAIAEGPGIWETRHCRLKTAGMEDEQVTVINDPLDVNSYRAESEHFIDCVLNDAPPQVTVEDGLRALEISHAILQAHRTKQVQNLRKIR